MEGKRTKVTNKDIQHIWNKSKKNSSLVIFVASLLHTTQHTRLRHISHINEDIISRMTVERRLQPLLVKMVTNKSDAATKNEQTVQSTDLDILVSLLRSKRTAIPEQVNKADSNATINVKYKLRRPSNK